MGNWHDLDEDDAGLGFDLNYTDGRRRRKHKSRRGSGKRASDMGDRERKGIGKRASDQKGSSHGGGNNLPPWLMDFFRKIAEMPEGDERRTDYGRMLEIADRTPSQSRREDFLRRKAKGDAERDRAPARIRFNKGKATEADLDLLKITDETATAQLQKLADKREAAIARARLRTQEARERRQQQQGMEVQGMGGMGVNGADRIGTSATPAILQQCLE